VALRAVFFLFSQFVVAEADIFGAKFGVYFENENQRYGTRSRFLAKVVY